MKRRDAYAGYRRYHAPPPPARVVAGCLAFALVVGFLFAAQGHRLGSVLAGLTAALFVALAPHVGGVRPAGVGAFVWCACLMAGIAAERAYYGAVTGVVVFGVLALVSGAVAMLYRRPPGHGGVIR